MQISETNRDGVTILRPKGKITIGTAEEALRDTVQRVLDNGAKKILINMADVTMIDSSGIGEVVSAFAKATNRQAQLRLSNLPDKISDILTITQLITVFEIDDTEDEAVAAFQ